MIPPDYDTIELARTVRCTCGDPIKWVTTEKGKRMPVNAVPLQVVVGLGGATDGAPHTGVRPGYVSHFATCPHAGTHRKRTPPG